MDAQDFRSLQEAYMEVVENQQLDEASGGIIGGKLFSSGSSQLKQKPKSFSKLGRKIGKSLSGFSFGDEKPKDIVKRVRNWDDSDLNRLSRSSDEKEPRKGRSRSAREFQLKVIEREKRRRSKTNEEYDLYDIILSHLLDEGYAETLEAAESMMVHMSEEWREDIVEETLDEAFKRFPYKKVEDKIHKKEADNPTGRGTPQTVKMGKVFRHFKGGKEVGRVEKREYSPQISKAKAAENRARGTQKEQADLYDIILSHLLDEGYVETPEAAESIMVNMSEEWRDSICEEYKKLPVGKMMRKVSNRAERDASTRAERDRKLLVSLMYKANQPYNDRARAEHEKAERNKERSNKMIRVADAHSKKAAKAKSKFKK